MSGSTSLEIAPPAESYRDQESPRATATRWRWSSCSSRKRSGGANQKREIDSDVSGAGSAESLMAYRIARPSRSNASAMRAWCRHSATVARTLDSRPRASCISTRRSARSGIAPGSSHLRPVRATGTIGP